MIWFKRERIRNMIMLPLLFDLDEILQTSSNSTFNSELSADVRSMELSLNLAGSPPNVAALSLSMSMIISTSSSMIDSPIFY